MAALLEKMPPDYALATCPEKPSDDTIKVRPVVQQKPEDITSRMPADWRQQLLRHIEAKRLDRVRKWKWKNRTWREDKHPNTSHSEAFFVSICLSLCCQYDKISVWLHVCSIHTVALTFCTARPWACAYRSHMTWNTIQLKEMSLHHKLILFHGAYLKVASPSEMNCSESKLYGLAIWFCHLFF